MTNVKLVQTLFEKILTNYFKSIYFHEVNLENEFDKKNFDHYQTGDVLIFEEEADYKNDHLELYSICKAEKTIIDNYVYSYRVDDPGVRYYKDGSGEPPSSDMKESRRTYRNCADATIGLIKFIIQAQCEDILNSIVEQEFEEIAGDEYEANRAEAIEEFNREKE